MAHFVIERHHPVAQFQCSFDSERNYDAEELRQQFNLVEAQADKLAASLLMPFFIVETALKDYNNGNKLRIYGDNVLAPVD